MVWVCNFTIQNHVCRTCSYCLCICHICLPNFWSRSDTAEKSVVLCALLLEACGNCSFFFCSSFFNQILKYTPEDHTDYSNMLAAHELACNLAAQVTLEQNSLCIDTCSFISVQWTSNSLCMGITYTLAGV